MAKLSECIERYVLVKGDGRTCVAVQRAAVLINKGIEDTDIVRHTYVVVLADEDRHDCVELIPSGRNLETEISEDVLTVEHYVEALLFGNTEYSCFAFGRTEGYDKGSPSGFVEVVNHFSEAIIALEVKNRTTNCVVDTVGGGNVHHNVGTYAGERSGKERTCGNELEVDCDVRTKSGEFLVDDGTHDLRIFTGNGRPYVYESNAITCFSSAEGGVITDKAVEEHLDFIPSVLEEVTFALGNCAACGLDFEIVKDQSLLADIVDPSTKVTDVRLELSEVLSNLSFGVCSHLFQYARYVFYCCGTGAAFAAADFLHLFGNFVKSLCELTHFSDFFGNSLIISIVHVGVGRATGDCENLDVDRVNSAYAITEFSNDFTEITKVNFESEGISFSCFECELEFVLTVAERTALPAVVKEELEVVCFFERNFAVDVETAGYEQAFNGILKESGADGVKTGFGNGDFPFDPLAHACPVIASVTAANVVDPGVAGVLGAGDRGASVVLTVDGAGRGSGIEFSFQFNFSTGSSRLNALCGLFSEIFFVGLERFRRTNRDGIYIHEFFLRLESNYVLTLFEVEVEFAVVVTGGVANGVIRPFGLNFLYGTALVIGAVRIVLDIGNVTVCVLFNYNAVKNVNPLLREGQVTNLGKGNLIFENRIVDTKGSFDICSLRSLVVRAKITVQNIDRVKTGFSFGNINRPGNGTGIINEHYVRFAEVINDFPAIGNVCSFRANGDFHIVMCRIRSIFFLVLSPFCILEDFEGLVGC